MKRERPVFVLRLAPLKDVDPIKALRFALKLLLRRCGMRCLSIDEIKIPAKPDTPPDASG